LPPSNSKIVAVLTPARERPEGLERHIKSILSTTDKADVLVYNDDGPNPIGPTAAVNKLWRGNSEYKYYMFGSTDHFMIDNGWCDRLIETVDKWPGKIGVAWNNDSLGAPHRDPGAIARFPFVSAEFLNVLGWFFLPGTFRYYPDDALTHLAFSTRAGYLVDVISKHEHNPVPSATAATQHDFSVYYNWLRDTAPSDIARLLEAMNV